MKKLIIILCCLLGATAYAQRFDATLWAGINACQIDGDASGHYNHFGPHAAINTTFSLSADADSPLRMLVEMGFTNKGAYESSAARKISLNYVELPLMLTYRLGNSRVGAGVAPAILVSSHARYTSGEEDLLTSQNYRPMDRLPVMLDWTYVRNHLAISVRFQNSLLPICKESGIGTYRIFRSNKGQFSKLLTLGIGYKF